MRLMIIRSRPSRAEERHKQLVNKISGHWGQEKFTIDDEKKSEFNADLTNILIIIVGVLAFIVLIISFCQPLVKSNLWRD